MVRRQGRVEGTSRTFGGDFPFFQVFEFPANKLWISWGFFILLKLPWPPACAGRSLCLHKIPLLSARSPSLCRNHYRFGSKSFLGGFLALNFQCARSALASPSGSVFLWVPHSKVQAGERGCIITPLSVSGPRGIRAMSCSQIQALRPSESPPQPGGSS